MNPDTLNFRRQRLDELSKKFGGKAELGRALGYKDGAYVGQMIRGERVITEKTIEAIHARPGLRGWFDQEDRTEKTTINSLPAMDGMLPTKGRDVVIEQYETGGGMGSSHLILADQPGAIRRWHVDHEWLRLNVKGYTSASNLRIVTGFGPSMRPMFNPGDPLLVDVGVSIVDHEGVFFFRVGEDGYIKILQRIPKPGGGRLLRAKSKNPEFDSFEIDEDTMDFQVLGKVLTVWRSEHY